MMNHKFPSHFFLHLNLKIVVIDIIDLLYLLNLFSNLRTIRTGYTPFFLKYKYKHHL